MISDSTSESTTCGSSIGSAFLLMHMKTRNVVQLCIDLCICINGDKNRRRKRTWTSAIDNKLKVERPPGLRQKTNYLTQDDSSNSEKSNRDKSI